VAQEDVADWLSGLPEGDEELRMIDEGLHPFLGLR